MNQSAGTVGLAATLCMLGAFLVAMNPSTAAAQTSVDAKCNIYGAGHATPPGPGGSVGGGDGGGILPVEIAIPGGTGRSVQFDLSGTVDYGGCCPVNGPDGLAFTGLIAQPVYGGLAGCDLPVRARYLAAVFLDDTEPVDPGPANLQMADITFTVLNPALNQIFFIGDGWTGDGSGTAQVFNIPDGATRLYLGYQDRCSASPNIPGCYDDNQGTVTGSVTFPVATAVLSPPKRGATLEQNFPNPFNPLTSISFRVGKAGYYELAIYDVRGNRVRELVGEWLDAGQYVRMWNGTDDSSESVSSGVYYYRLEGAGGGITRRMALIR